MLSQAKRRLAEPHAAPTMIGRKATELMVRAAHRLSKSVAIGRARWPIRPVCPHEQQRPTASSKQRRFEHQVLPGSI